MMKPWLLLATDPKLKGLLIAAPAGTGKSHMARAYQRLLPAPFIELPLNISADRLLGGIDLERTMRTGRRRFSQGLLAAAHGGTLYIDEINLLDKQITQLVANAHAQEFLAIEREGLSARADTDFTLIGSFDPAEGDLSPALIDRVGLSLSLNPQTLSDARVEIMAAALTGSDEEEQLELALFGSMVAEARARLGAVEMDREARRLLVSAALSLGVESNRADIFAARAARANAALAGRTRVDEEDLEEAIKYVLLPRATVIPAQPPPPQHEQHHERRNQERENVIGIKIEDLVVKALDTVLPTDILAAPAQRLRQARTGSRNETLSRTRGRQVRSIAGKPRDGRIALADTLRAAAQRGARKQADRPIEIKLSDLRIKRFHHKAGILFIFAVDASGSMALNRMNQAKGALTRLLSQAYVHRDKVALISFRGSTAELLLPPSQSVERAKRLLDALPVGGGTPLTAGLVAALDLATRARRGGIRQIMLLLFSDGRANVALGAQKELDRDARQRAIHDELARVSVALQHEGVFTVVIDTESHFTSGGAARELADLLVARYLYLPRADAASIYNAIDTNLRASVVKS